MEHERPFPVATADYFRTLFHDILLVQCGVSDTWFAFVFFKGATQALGVALIVGGLFSFGAFVAQIWSAAVQREAEAFDRAFDEGDHDIRRTDLRRLAKAWWELSERVTEEARPSVHDTSTSAT